MVSSKGSQSGQEGLDSVCGPLPPPQLGPRSVCLSSPTGGDTLVPWHAMLDPTAPPKAHLLVDGCSTVTEWGDPMKDMSSSALMPTSLQSLGELY